MRLTDAIGRYVAYTYDGDHLVSVDQNGRGITRYTYDKKGYISAITDQNNKRYTENIFDSRGRVTGRIIRTKRAAASPMMTLRTARHSFIRRPEEPKRPTMTAGNW